ncbi:prolactin-7A1-like isoform X1 [Arvicanthis niloticus]|uniref:prolactin-7A1-like isoform X1 n=1 Tax=Arvicanthis niloticus TaxID=61156 RepID=UPI001486662B|nr:prolactin-7A1-like isoform X1 [Arvicanthis niloticus]
MSLSFTQPCSSGALLLLVVSSLFLWENVTSVPLSSNETDDDPLSIKGLFDHTMILSKNISDLNMELRRIFTVSEMSAKLFDKFLSSSSSDSHDQFMLEFLGHQELLDKNLTYCHKYSIKTPEDIEEAQKVISLEAFPNLILSRIQAWNETLKNVINLLESTPGMDDDILPIYKNIETNTAELLEDTKSILSQIYGTKNVDDYNLWSGLEEFQSSDEESRFLALCKLSYCLHVDIHTANFYLQFLRCVVLVNSDSCLSPKTGNDS